MNKHLFNTLFLLGWLLTGYSLYNQHVTEKSLEQCEIYALAIETAGE
jgi:hypothetical protein